MKKAFLFITNILLLVSCSKNESETIDAINSFGDFYKIESITSNKTVDLNNDGINSTNLKQEIPNYFEGNSYDLTIRKLDGNSPFKLLLGIYLPVPNEYIDKPYGIISYYRNAFFKKINQETNETLINKKTEISTEIILEKLIILENKKIVSKFNQRFYDFKTNSWKNLEIEIKYLKNG